MIEAYCGLPGAGKTYCMIMRLRKTLGRFWNRKKTVLSNLPLNEEHLRKLTKWEGKLQYMYDWEDLVDAENAIVLIDELNLWMPSRVWNKVPGPLLYKWAQVRKSGLEIWFTCQSASRVDKVVRELVFESYHLTSYKRLNIFVSKAYIGLGEKQTAKAIIPFRKSVAKIYDTYGYINVPEIYQGEIMGRKKDKITKKDEAFNKEKEKDEQKIIEENIKEEEDDFFKVSGKKLNSMDYLYPPKESGRYIKTKSGRKIFVPGMTEQELKELQKKNPGQYFDVEVV